MTYILANECPRCGTANPYVCGQKRPARCCGCGAPMERLEVSMYGAWTECVVVYADDDE